MKDKALVAFSDTIITSALDRIRDVLESGWIAAGKNAREYEAHLARLAHRRHAVATSSATAAYEVGMRALGLRDGQMVFAANSFVGMPLLCARFDLEPVFCDVTVEAGMAPTWEQVAAVLTERTVAVCLTQLGGFVARDAPRIEQECRQRGIILIEDCTHALGASYQQRYAGSFGDFSFASTQATKVFSTGEGGGLLTDREDVVQRARELMTFGSRERVSGGPIAYEEGYAWRASELAAALGAAVFAEADDILARRRQLAHTYDRLWEQANLDQFGLRRAPSPMDVIPFGSATFFCSPPICRASRSKTRSLRADSGWTENCGRCPCRATPSGRAVMNIWHFPELPILQTTTPACLWGCAWKRRTRRRSWRLYTTSCAIGRGLHRNGDFYFIVSPQ